MSPMRSAWGSVRESPMIMSVKKMPIEITWPEFWKVEFMPDPTPRCSAGRAFMTLTRLGAAKAPMASPFMKSSSPNVG